MIHEWLRVSMKGKSGSTRKVRKLQSDQGIYQIYLQLVTTDITNNYNCIRQFSGTELIILQVSSNDVV